MALPMPRRYGELMAGPLRVVIGEDDVLMREGIARLLTEAGHEVVPQAGDAQDLLRKGLAHRPDVVVADVQMQAERADDGMKGAIELVLRRPETDDLLLSRYCDLEYADDFSGDRPEAVG